MHERNPLLKVYAVDGNRTYRTFFLQREGVSNLIKCVNAHRERDIEVGALHIQARLPNGEKVSMVCDIWVDAQDLILQEPDQNLPEY